jgi:hypothetical protein
MLIPCPKQSQTLAQLLANGTPTLVVPKDGRACATSLTPWPEVGGAPTPLYAVALHHKNKDCAFVLMPNHLTPTRRVGLFRVKALTITGAAAHPAPARPSSDELKQIEELSQASAESEQRHQMSLLACKSAAA